MEGLGENFKPSHDYSLSVAQDLEAETQPAKTVTAVFCLSNRKAKRELKVYVDNKLLPFCSVPTYLRVKLDRLLTFRHHLETLRKKLPNRVTLLRRLARSGRGAGAKTMHTAALFLVYSLAENYPLAWYCSAHTRLIDGILNDALCIVTGCLRPTPTGHLSVLLKHPAS